MSEERVSQSPTCVYLAVIHLNVLVLFRAKKNTGLENMDVSAQCKWRYFFIVWLI